MHNIAFLFNLWLQINIMIIITSIFIKVVTKYLCGKDLVCCAVDGALGIYRPSGLSLSGTLY